MASDWLVHTNRRPDGAWTQRYGRGVPVTDLLPVEPDGTTGTTVHLLACDRAVPDMAGLTWPAGVLGEVVDLR